MRRGTRSSGAGCPPSGSRCSATAPSSARTASARTITAAWREPDGWQHSLYLGDAADVAEAVAIFKGWLGDETAYDSFTWKSDLSWQADPANPVGVNPAGATKSGFSIDGALPEEMRRGCSFTVPPCPTTYPWGALQGTLLVAEMLSRQGHDAWNWEDQALLRAADFVHDLELAYGGWWAQGDDIWQPWLINHAYGTDYPTVPVTRIGKTFGWSDWLWGSSSGGGGGDAPVANFSATPRSGSAPLAVTFTDTSTNAPTNWAWTFGDGATFRRHPSHTYSAPGSYTVTLTATNADGSDGETKVGYITVSPSGGGGLTVTPSDDTYVSSSSPTAVSGSANNLRVRGGSTQLHTYLKFSVSGAGSVGQATLRLWVLDASPDGGSLFAVPDSTWSESSMNWNNREPISGGAIDSAGPVGVGSWVEFDVSSVVTGDGTYSFALISAVSDVARYGSSEASAATRPQLVLDGSGGGGGDAPVANFSATPRSGSAPLAVTFTDTSTNAPTNWAWTFGDGATLRPTAPQPHLLRRRQLHGDPDRHQRRRFGWRDQGRLHHRQPVRRRRADRHPERRHLRLLVEPDRRQRQRQQPARARRLDPAAHVSEVQRVGRRQRRPGHLAPVGPRRQP